MNIREPVTIRVMRPEEAPQCMHECVEHMGSINQLMKQLSGKEAFATELELAMFLHQATLLLAFQESKVVGMLTLFLLRKPSRHFAQIEDVVVDEKRRGLGIGRTMMQYAMKEASLGGSQHIDLTSRSERQAANNLYQELGFHRRDTNVYRFTFGIQRNLPFSK